LATEKNFIAIAAKDVKYGTDARARMLHGVDVLANAVGVTVAKDIELADKFENMGAQMVKEVASKASDLAGDGTTTATVLTQAIVREGAKAVAAGMCPMDLKRGVNLAVEAVIEDMRKRSKKVSTNAEIAQVGTISALMSCSNSVARNVREAAWLDDVRRDSRPANLTFTGHNVEFRPPIAFQVFDVKTPIAVVWSRCAIKAPVAGHYVDASLASSRGDLPAATCDN